MWGRWKPFFFGTDEYPGGKAAGGAAVLFSPKFLIHSVFLPLPKSLPVKLLLPLHSSSFIVFPPLWLVLCLTELDQGVDNRAIPGLRFCLTMGTNLKKKKGKTGRRKSFKLYLVVFMIIIIIKKKSPSNKSQISSA